MSQAGRPHTIRFVSKRSIKRKLAKTSSRLTTLRAELTAVEEQLRSLADDADDTAIRAMVDDNTAATRDAREAREHAEAYRRQHARVVAEIDALVRRQDQLLDQLVAAD
jgi:septal ring factor EnvC (AmiA/AmiB activator)